MSEEELTLEVNGTRRTARFAGDVRLIDALRALGYTGTKEGCGEGECGACTVLLAGRPVNSCLVYAKQAVGKPIRTVEGMGQRFPSGLHPFQEALVQAGGVQCGFCTPGMVVTGAHHLDGGGSAEPEAVREAIAGNLCRCTGYAKILEAAAAARSSLSGKVG